MAGSRAPASEPENFAARQAMYQCGLWGVPSFRYGDTSYWGQDRLWVIDDAIWETVKQKEGASA